MTATTPAHILTSGRLLTPSHMATAMRGDISNQQACLHYCVERPRVRFEILEEAAVYSRMAVACYGAPLYLYGATSARWLCIFVWSCVIFCMV